MLKSVSESIERSVAETIPTDSDWFWPNGLPIAATVSPTWTSASEPSVSGLQVEPLGVDLEQRDVRERVEADDLGADLVAVGELDEDLVRLVQRPARRARRLGVGHDVRVGEDLALVGDHESRALTSGRAASAEDPAARIVEDGDHGDHAGHRVLVDRSRVEGAVLGLDHDPLASSVALVSVAPAVTVVVESEPPHPAISPAATVRAASAEAMRAVTISSVTASALGRRSSNSVRPRRTRRPSEPPIRRASSRPIASPRPDPDTSSPV